jgi:4-amino-4-deoxy-L-arabinose transferase-like glycosyltransferase
MNAEIAVGRSRFGGDTERHTAFLLALLLLALAAYRAFAMSRAALPLSFDEAQYWGWSQALDWGYFSKPPMVAALIRVATAVCGDGEVCVRAPAYTGLALTAWFVFLAVARLHGARAGFLAAVTFATLPIASFTSFAVTADVPLFLFWTIALYTFIRALEDGRWVWWIATGLAGGLGLQSKYTMGVFAISVLAYLLWAPGERARLRSPKLWVAALVASAVFLPNLAWNAAHDFPTFRHTSEISQLARAFVHPGEFLQFTIGQLAVFGPILGVAVLIAVVNAFRRKRDKPTRLWVAFTLPFLAVIGFQALLARANLNWAAPAAVGGTALAIVYLLERGRTRWLAAAIGVNVVLGLVLYHVVPAAQALGLPARLDATLRLKGWPELGAGVRDALAKQPGARFVGYQRSEIAEMLYYARPLAAHPLVWNPERRISDHYRLTADVATVRHGPFVIGTGDDRFDALSKDFKGLVRIGTVDTAACQGCRRLLHLYYADEFVGYHP